mgnify:FL=1
MQEAEDEKKQALADIKNAYPRATNLDKLIVDMDDDFNTTFKLASQGRRV